MMQLIFICIGLVCLVIAIELKLDKIIGKSINKKALRSYLKGASSITLFPPKVESKAKKFLKEILEKSVEEALADDFKKVLNDLDIAYDKAIKTICPECREIRIDDDRVANGMKCSYCAYGDPKHV